MVRRTLAHCPYRPILFVPRARLGGEFNRSQGDAFVFESGAFDGGGGVFVRVEVRRYGRLGLGGVAAFIVECNVMGFIPLSGCG